MRVETREAFRKIFDKIGVVKHGHFVLNNGKHSDLYIDKYELFRRPPLLQEFCSMAMDAFLADVFPEEFDIIVGPESGGAKLAQELALQYSLNRFNMEVSDDSAGLSSEENAEDDQRSQDGESEGSFADQMDEFANVYLEEFIRSDLMAIYPHKSGDGNYVLRAGEAELLKGKRVLVVDDVITSADTLKKVITLVRSCGATILGVFVIWDRSVVVNGLSALDGLSVYAFAFDQIIGMAQWEPDKCKLCKMGIAIDDSLGRGGGAL